MRAVVTRVRNASVTIDGRVNGEIGQGFLVLLGVGPQDTEAQAEKMADKVCGLRVFEDEAGKMNRNLEAVGGELLVVSQFTLYADCRKGNRPSFIKAGPPDMADRLYQYVLEKCRGYAGKVESGSFGAHMEVKLVNDGPFTVVLDSDELWKQTEDRR